jgi:Mg-chelatase subunit ChlI
MHNDFHERVLASSFDDILGQSATKEQVKSALLMNRHIIIVGQPGIGKTTLAKNIASLLPDQVLHDCALHCDPDKKSVACTDKKAKKRLMTGAERFVRVQGSPDLTSEDLIGDIDPVKALSFGPLSLEAFTPGKLFKANNGILFFDEVNRCSEKLQNTLLQVLEERKVTIGSYTVDIDVDFIFVGTMNPEDTSTEPLSDVFIDRFDLIVMGYPESIEIEEEIVKKSGKVVCTFPPELLRHVLIFIRNLRQDPNIEKRPSVRASIGVYERSQAHAIVKGRTTVTLADVAAILSSVLGHRMRLKPSLKFLTSPDKYLAEEFHKYNDRGDYL